MANETCGLSLLAWHDTGPRCAKHIGHTGEHRPSFRWRLSHLWFTLRDLVNW